MYLLTVFVSKNIFLDQKNLSSSSYKNDQQLFSFKRNKNAIKITAKLLGTKMMHHQNALLNLMI
jgi:hypothetical protein